ncbi:hypothetical protein KKF91_05630 [Myxococcota bacterium]|nr:hypothetical protein [Myxococcota bacterium]MBU1430030.1 hypothetical protein [Myxococcota bacterium]MBU1899427.1 hypothetical protein [Myxococcota bacterium]
MRTRTKIPAALCFLGLMSLMARPAVALEFDDPEVQAALAELKAEPSIQDVQAAALRFFNLDPSTVSSMRTRASFKALLPDVTVRYANRDSTVNANKFDLMLFPGEDPANIDDANAAAQEIQVSGTWSLSRLAFNPEVLDVGSLAVLQEGVLKEITRLYYTRRRLQVDLILDPPKDGATRLSKTLRIEEMTATLDAMTGNLFARYQARLDRRDARRGGR